MNKGSRETMRDLGTTAINVRKQLSNLDLSALKLSSLKEHTPTDRDVSKIRKRESDASSRGFLGGFLLGAVVGVLIALLFAPRRGDEARRMVSQSTEVLRGKSTGLVHQVRPDAEPAIAPPRREYPSEPAIERTFGD